MNTNNTHFHPIDHNFNIGDKVTDKTAESNNWPDKTGEIIEIDGSNVKVKYTSGNTRWKKHISLRIQPMSTNTPLPTREHIDIPGGWTCPITNKHTDLVFWDSRYDGTLNACEHCTNDKRTISQRLEDISNLRK